MSRLVSYSYGKTAKERLQIYQEMLDDWSDVDNDMNQYLFAGFCVYIFRWYQNIQLDDLLELIEARDSDEFKSEGKRVKQRYWFEYGNRTKRIRCIELAIKILNAKIQQV